MKKIVETSLVIKKETKFDKIRDALFNLFFHKEYEMMQRLDELLKIKRVEPNKIIIPKEIKKDVYKRQPLYKEIIEEVDINNLILMGDSAGGGMALALAERMGEENIQMPNKTILISPWLDVRLQNPEIDEVQKRDKELSKETLKLAGVAYAGEDGIDSYLVNPIDGNLSKLKNITILTGTNDILNPDVHVLQEKAKQIGVNIEIKEYESAGHIWIINNNSSEELVQKGYNDLINLVNE